MARRDKLALKDHSLLKAELEKVLKAGRHAFESGYRHAVNHDRGRPHNFTEVERFVAERYKFLNTFHPLVGVGFIWRMGHYNNSARRFDWQAVSRDITNLHLGASSPDKMTETLKDIEFPFRRRGIAIKFDTNFEFFHWPDVLRSPDGVIGQVVEVLASKKGELHIRARKGSGRVKLNLTFSKQKRLNAKEKETLLLAKEIVSYFSGEFKEQLSGISINLPYSIRVDSFYGG